MNYAYSLLLLFSLASYLINGMDPSDFVWGIESEKIVCEWQPKWSYQCSFKYQEIGYTYHLKDALKPYLDGEEKTVSNEIIEQLKGADNISLFNACIDRFEKKGWKNFAPLALLMPILFDSEVLKRKRDGAIRAFNRHPQILNKALFGLKMSPLQSEDIDCSSGQIKESYFVDPLEKSTLDIEDSDEWFLVNQQFFYRIYSSNPYLKSMRPMTKKEKERYWQDALSSKFHADCCDPEAVERYRAQVKTILLMNKRLKKAKGVGIEKRVLYPQIIVPLFEQEFTDFKKHCNNMEIALGKEIFLTNIKDVDQKPFFYNFRGWYDQERKECFKNLETFETVQKILSYKFGK